MRGPTLAPDGALSGLRGATSLHGARADRPAALPGHVEVTPLDHPPTDTDRDREAAALCRRVAALERLPDIAKQIAVTGGKDSRLVLAAARRAGTLDAIGRLYLKALPEHPDAIVGASLARAVGRRLERIDPPSARLDLLEATRAHLFASECAPGPWDHKHATERPAILGVHGNYGEIFKSHVKPSFLLGGAVAGVITGRRPG